MRLSAGLSFLLTAVLAGSGCHGNSGHGNGNPSPTCTLTGACQVACPGGTTTTLTGKVYAPNGTLPLYNAIVYVPNSTPAPFPNGATCDRCNGEVSGNPIVQTLTAPDGSFRLDNVPTGADVPLVVQIGKWRRQVTIASPARCASTPVPPDKTRLPASHREGDIPQMAIASGWADPFECLLRKMGIDDNEVTVPSGGGRIHYYLGGTMPGTTMPQVSSENDAQNGLFTGIGKLMQYDVVMLPCEGVQAYRFPGNATTEQQLLVQYLNLGGRVFATHFSHNWLSWDGSPFNRIGNMSMPPDDVQRWPVNQPDPMQSGYIATLDDGFPKGMAFKQWLASVQSTTPPSKPVTEAGLELVEPRNDLDTINSDLAQRWMYHAGDDKVLHMTFNTPLDAPMNDMGGRDYCGRVVFSDFHVSADALDNSVPRVYPDACKKSELTTQERALVFMLFDLSSCVQPDQSVPIS